MDFDLKKIPAYKRALSYFHPVWLSNRKGTVNPTLELLLYKGRIQLATADALYSDGVYYTPALAVTNHLRKFLPGISKVLVLGVGLGSMVQVIRKMGLSPSFTLVEIDEVVLQLALGYLQLDADVSIDAVCQDARLFMATNTVQFDLIFIDIFDSRVVPEFTTSAGFLRNCRACIAPGGRVAFNYIVNDEKKWQKTQEVFASIFPRHTIINSDINRIFIAEL